MTVGRLRLPLALAAATLAVTAAAPGAVANSIADAAAGATPRAEPAAAGTRAPAGADPQVHLELRSLAPAAPKPKGRLTLRGALVNPETTALREVSVALRVSTSPVTNRGDITPIAAGTAAARAGRAVSGGTKAVPGQVFAAEPGEWEIAVPVKALRLGGNGVYVLQLTATGRGPDDTAVRQLATLTTFLPYLPDQKQYDPTRLSWLWPLASTPARDAHGVFLSEGLGAELAPGGRLADLSAAPGRTPVTWMVDPELLEAAKALGADHEKAVPGEGEDTDGEDGNAVAARWLADLRARLAERPPAALPYADPDLAALAHHGGQGSLARAVARSKSTTAALLPRESDTTVAWPVDGFADAATLGMLRRTGANTVVLSSAALVPAQERTYTPTGRARVDADGKPLEVLVADQGLADALSGDLRAPGAAALATQRFLADSALITLERPNVSRTVLVTPPRRWNPPAGWSANLLAATGAAPWLRAVGLSALSRTPVPAEYSDVALTYPQAAADAELSRAQIGRMSDGNSSAGDLIRLLARPGELELTYTSAVLGTVSSAWRADRSGGRSYAEGVAETIGADSGLVRVIGRNLVTLSSTRGTIPLTVSNGLKQAIRVQPVLRPRVGSRLTVTNPAMLTIGAGRKATVKVPAEAASNGITQVDIQLLDATGRAFGPTKALKVNVTSFGKVGLIVLVAAGSILFGAALVRNVRRIRRRIAT